MGESRPASGASQRFQLKNAKKATTQPNPNAIGTFAAFQKQGSHLSSRKVHLDTRTQVSGPLTELSLYVWYHGNF
jgi:hypothetical protein